MAEEQEVETTVEKKSFILTAVLIMAALLVPGVIGLGTYTLWLKPKLSMENVVEAAPIDEIPAFPISMTSVVFDEVYITVQTEDPDVPSPLLVMQLALSCADGATSALIDARKEYFAAEILNVHQGRTRAELNDALVKNSILEQIKQRSNILLKRLSPEAELEVLQAMYVKFTIMDMG